jgi:hypothetical protein
VVSRAGVVRSRSWLHVSAKQIISSLAKRPRFAQHGLKLRSLGEPGAVRR